jgi:hypothetical protein
MWWEVLTRIKWSKVLPIAVVLAAIAAAGVYIFLLKIDVQVAEAERDAAEARQMIAEASYDRCKVNRVVLQAAIDARNEAIRKWKEEADARAEAQGAADSLAFRLAHAEAARRRTCADRHGSGGARCLQNISARTLTNRRTLDCPTR